MVVIFGWGADGAKDLGEVAPITCPNCHNEVFYHYSSAQKRISFYFVPMVPYGVHEVLSCPICRAGVKLTLDQREVVSRMRATTTLFRTGRIPKASYDASVAAFWARMGFVPAVPVVGAGSASAPAVLAPSARPTLAERLEELGRLHADGVLTDDEFALAKRRLIEG
ncbi:MAG TPA: SHOCT domain-containing protein [Candidatus Limnocylindrales bacterium]